MHADICVLSIAFSYLVNRKKKKWYMIFVLLFICGLLHVLCFPSLVRTLGTVIKNLV